MKQPPAISFRSWLYLALVCAFAIGLSGCSTTESENTSSKPWNSPEGWQSGVPSQMLNGR